MRGKWRKEVSGMVKSKQVKGEDYGLNCVASLPVQIHMLQSQSPAPQRTVFSGVGFFPENQVKVRSLAWIPNPVTCIHIKRGNVDIYLNPESNKSAINSKSILYYFFDQVSFTYLFYGPVHMRYCDSYPNKKTPLFLKINIYST